MIKHHGVHFLEVKQKKIVVNKTNRNDLYKELGPPSTVGTFDNDMLIYIERKTSTLKITRLGKKELLTNDVLILEVDKRGIIISKKFTRTHWDIAFQPQGKFINFLLTLIDHF